MEDSLKGNRTAKGPGQHSGLMRCGQFRKQHTELRKIRRDKVSGSDFGYIDVRKSFRHTTTELLTRLLAELHRDSLYPMMGKTLGAWVAGADRREAPGPKPVRLGPTPQWGSPRSGSAASHPNPDSSGMVEFSEESPRFPRFGGCHLWGGAERRFGYLSSHATAAHSPRLTAENVVNLT